MLQEGDTQERRLEGSRGHQLEGSQEHRQVGNQEHQLEDSQERQLEDSQERRLEDSQERRLEDNQERQPGGSQERQLEGSRDRLQGVDSQVLHPEEGSQDSQLEQDSHLREDIQELGNRLREEHILAEEDIPVENHQLEDSPAQ